MTRLTVWPSEDRWEFTEVTTPAPTLTESQRNDFTLYADPMGGSIFEDLISILEGIHGSDFQLEVIQ